MAGHEVDSNTDEGPLARTLRSGAMVGVAALIFATGIASGMLADGTSESIMAFRASAAERAAPTRPRRPAVLVSYQPGSVDTPVGMQSALTQAATQPAAWFPANNSVDWQIGLAPGQQTSGLSVRNSDSDRNLVVVLNVRNDAGEWNRAGVVNVEAGREAIVRPPVGSYAMTFLTLAKGTPYSALGNATPSGTVYFDLSDPEGTDTTPVTRFISTAGQPKRLPDLTSYAAGGAQTASAEPDDDTPA